MENTEDNAYYPPQTHSYFYGRISREEAEKILERNGMQNGMFLLREVMNKIGFYIVSVVANDKIRHYEISRTPGGELQINGVKGEYPGPIDVIKRLKKDDIPINLNIPCNRNFSTQPIQYMFISTQDLNEAVVKLIKKKVKDNIDCKTDAEGKYRYRYEELALRDIHATQRWFRKGFTKRDAKKLFSLSINKKNGAFIVRLSNFMRTLKLNIWNEAKHDIDSYRILIDNHSFFIKDSAGEDFDTLTQLVDFYSREVGKKYIDITLKQPCADEEFYSFKCDTNRSYEINVMGRENTENDDRDIYRNIKMIEFKNYQVKLIKLIGAGAFSKVYQGEYRSHNGKITKKVAVKILLNVDPVSLMSEKKMLKSLEHKYIVRLQETIDDDDLNEADAIDANSDFRNKCILLEFAELGSLSSYLRTHTMDRKNMLIIAKQIAEALEFLASKSIIHRDVAARNVLLFKADLAKLSDFGLTRTYNSTDYYIQATPLQGVPIKWYAPEVINSNTFNEKSDVYSYGVMLWEMFSFGDTPFKDENIQEPNLFAKKIKNGEIKLRKPEDCLDSVYNLMNSCWRLEKTNRPAFIEIQAEIDYIIQTMQQ